MVVIKRSQITLFSGQTDLMSHFIRVILAEKEVNVDIVPVDLQSPSEDFTELSPAGQLPLLVDRELIIDIVDIMAEYLDERFPYPPLLPVYPVTKAKYRMIVDKILTEWYPLVNKIVDSKCDKARKELAEQMIKASAAIEKTPYFSGPDYTMVDCIISPILWRLHTLDLSLSEHVSQLYTEYAERLFERKTFQASLTEEEFSMSIVDGDDELN